MPRVKRYKRTPNYKRRRIISLCVTAVIVVFAVWLGSQFIAYTDAQKPVDPSDTAKIAVDVPDGYGVTEIAALLEEKGIIKSGKFFELRSTIERTRGNYKAGSYELSKSMNAEEIMAVLVEGENKEVVKFTVPEGYTTAQTMKVLVEAGLMSEDEFWAEVESGSFDYKFLEGAPAGRSRLEGFLYPETYETYREAGAHAVIDTMLGQFDKLFTQEHYDRAAKLKRSVRDIVTIASLIERETAVEGERVVVSRVIYNRLKEDMPLQIDAAIQFMLPEPKEFLTESDLAIESDYNTYINKGLPPGPICSPRISSIDAALHPKKGKQLFYVLDPALNGMHRFTENYDEFLVDKQAYQEAIAARDSGQALEE